MKKVFHNYVHAMHVTDVNRYRLRPLYPHAISLHTFVYLDIEMPLHRLFILLSIALSIGSERSVVPGRCMGSLRLHEDDKV